MQGLIQRVTHASVSVGGKVVGETGPGLLLLLGVEKADTETSVSKLASKVLHYRVFGDALGHMNLSLLDTGGSLLVVSQFTLAADTRKGLRPSFSAAAPPEEAEKLYEKFVAEVSRQVSVGTGVFGADMQVSLVNDGPVTFLLKS